MLLDLPIHLEGHELWLDGDILEDLEDGGEESDQLMGILCLHNFIISATYLIYFCQQRVHDSIVQLMSLCLLLSCKGWLGVRAHGLLMALELLNEGHFSEFGYEASDKSYKRGLFFLLGFELLFKITKSSIGNSSFVSQTHCSPHVGIGDQASQSRGQEAQ
jgi:hypothetical protein